MSDKEYWSWGTESCFRGLNRVAWYVGCIICGSRFGSERVDRMRREGVELEKLVGKMLMGWK